MSLYRVRERCEPSRPHSYAAEPDLEPARPTILLLYCRPGGLVIEPSERCDPRDHIPMRQSLTLSRQGQQYSCCTAGPEA
ncbi:hypothetical protein J6590_043738 [Homalodisca vitripennis]|nr:hypothetical protein J6590_043738 [Homalodisca vitripennis]